MLKCLSEKAFEAEKSPAGPSATLPSVTRGAIESDPSAKSVEAHTLFPLLTSFCRNTFGISEGRPNREAFDLLNAAREEIGQKPIPGAVFEEARHETLVPLNKFSDGKVPVYSATRKFSGDITTGDITVDMSLTRAMAREQFVEFLERNPAVAFLDRSRQIRAFNIARCESDVPQVPEEVLENLRVESCRAVAVTSPSTQVSAYDQLLMGELGGDVVAKGNISGIVDLYVKGLPAEEQIAFRGLPRHEQFEYVQSELAKQGLFIPPVLFANAA